MRIIGGVAAVDPDGNRWAPWVEYQTVIVERDQWKGLALRLYRLMGEEGERLLPGDLDSTELLRAALDEDVRLDS